MRLEDLDYTLPPECIAQRPAEPRDASRLLALWRDEPTRPPRHLRFRDLPELLAPGDLIVVNDTRVLPARVFGRRVDTGGRIECLFVGEHSPGVWDVMARPARRLRPGLRLSLAEGALQAEVRAVLPDGMRRLALEPADRVVAVLEQAGHMPLPPYIAREAADEALRALDRDRYQTIFAREQGAVAAPTAGLHFTPRLLERLEARGVGRASITLHVGPGTFRPIATDDPTAHRMHAERYRCPPATLEAIERTRAAGGRVIACGTTTVRVLETIARGGPTEGWTELFIHPPQRIESIDGLITNFHLPRSSLLLLVAAWLGDLERLLAVYRDAIERGYRFYSYGDAMVIL